MGRHEELARELVEWWEDLWQRGMTSRVVLVAVPPGWGRTTVLDWLAEAAGAADAPVTLIARINGRELAGGPGAQAAGLKASLARAATRHPVAELLGVVVEYWAAGLTWGYGADMIGTRVCRAGLPAAGDRAVLARAAGALLGG